MHHLTCTGDRIEYQYTDTDMAASLEDVKLLISRKNEIEKDIKELDKVLHSVCTRYRSSLGH